MPHAPCNYTLRMRSRRVFAHGHTHTRTKICTHSYRQAQMDAHLNIWETLNTREHMHAGIDTRLHARAHRKQSPARAERRTFPVWKCCQTDEALLVLGILTTTSRALKYQEMPALLFTVVVVEFKFFVSVQIDVKDWGRKIIFVLFKIIFTWDQLQGALLYKCSTILESETFLWNLNIALVLVTQRYRICLEWIQYRTRDL